MTSVTFPVFLTTGCMFDVTIDGWQVAYVAGEPITFLDPNAVVRHVYEHPDEWTGDVFSVQMLAKVIFHEQATTMVT